MTLVLIKTTSIEPETRTRYIAYSNTQIPFTRLLGVLPYLLEQSSDSFDGRLRGHRNRAQSQECKHILARYGCEHYSLLIRSLSAVPPFSLLPPIQLWMNTRRARCSIKQFFNYSFWCIFFIFGCLIWRVEHSQYLCQKSSDLLTWRLRGQPEQSSASGVVHFTVPMKLQQDDFSEPYGIWQHYHLLYLKPEIM